MIRFDILTEDELGGMVLTLSEKCGAEPCDVDEILNSFLDLISEDPDLEVGVTSIFGCILVRIFDLGRYSFVYPIELSDDSDAVSAVESIREYAVREEIPLIFTDVPRHAVGELVTGFSHVNVDAEIMSESYRVEAKSECALLSEIPSITLDGLSLEPLRREDVSEIARLERDTRVNKFWGYDYLSDVGEVADSYFFELAEREFAIGQTLTLAARFEGAFIGEVMLYAFDLRGCAEIAVRLLPEFWGRGLGRSALNAAVRLGKQIGLSALTATIDEKNKISIRLFSSEFSKVAKEDGRVYFRLEI